MKIKKFSPCKVNLMLAITGVREDGFHDLISLVTPTKFGDDLETELLPDGATSDTLSCDLEGVPCDESNLVIKAAKLFRQATGLEKYFKFDLEKRTPAGAGLGGGSSNGAIALASMNELCGKPLSMRQLEKIAAELGSDCPLFLTGTPVLGIGLFLILQEPNIFSLQFLNFGQLLNPHIIKGIFGRLMEQDVGLMFRGTVGVLVELRLETLHFLEQTNESGAGLIALEIRYGFRCAGQVLRFHEIAQTVHGSAEPFDDERNGIHQPHGAGQALGVKKGAVRVKDDPLKLQPAHTLPMSVRKCMSWKEMGLQAA